MKFSELYHVRKAKSDDWFDPIIGYDTRLFIDPFLVFKTKIKLFENSHYKIIKFFNEVFKLIARSHSDHDSTFYKKAVSSLVFPEVAELSLGYVSSGTKGAGSAYGFSRIMADAIDNAIRRGIKSIEHFEELEIFNEGIGMDRISDMTANILKEELIEYTQEICRIHSIPMRRKRLRNTSFDFDGMRWLNEEVELPWNNKNSLPILLVPRRFLDKLPEINSTDFWDYLVGFENERLRHDLNYDITRRVDKKTIVMIARKVPALVEKYVKRKEKFRGNPYDFEKDQDNLIEWHDQGKEFVDENPLELSPPSNRNQFITIVNNIVRKFKEYIEFKGGIKLLWNDDNTQRKESAAQATFFGIAWPYCEANDIDISKEANMGRGSVDFKFSNGYRERQLLEVKKASTASRLFEKVRSQLPTYLKSEDIKNGVYLIIRYSDDDNDRIEKIEGIVKELNKNNQFNIEYFIINAEKQPSASKM